MNSIKQQLLKEGVICLPEKINWFPGHMYKGFNQLKENIQKIDVFLEIRDARLPISSKNYEIDKEIKLNQKQKIILFNKFDLCNKRITSQIINQYNQIGITCLPIEAKDGKSMHNIIKKALLMKSIKYPTIGLWMMVGGVPNVGKSTLLNQLRHKTSYEGHNRKKIVSTAPLPCTTRNVLGFKVCDNPLAYLIDTPGIIVPKISNEETALKLSLTGSIDDKIAGKEIIIEYMLYHLNKNNNKKYMEKYKLDQRCETAQDLVMNIRNKYHQIQYEVTFDMILKHFREGKLGNITLDSLDTQEPILIE